MVYMVTFTINISPMLAYIPYMDPMGFIELNGYILKLKESIESILVESMGIQSCLGLGVLVVLQAQENHFCKGESQSSI